MINNLSKSQFSSTIQPEETSKERSELRSKTITDISASNIAKKGSKEPISNKNVKISNANNSRNVNRGPVSQFSGSAGRSSMGSRLSKNSKKKSKKQNNVNLNSKPSESATIEPVNIKN